MKRNIICFLFLFFCFLLSGNLLLAQPGPPGGGGPPCWPPSACVPIDTGIGFLIAAVVAYGAKKIKDSLPKKKVRD